MLHTHRRRTGVFGARCARSLLPSLHCQWVFSTEHHATLSPLEAKPHEQQPPPKRVHARHLGHTLISYPRSSDPAPSPHQVCLTDGSDLYEDLSDGHILYHLLEVLSGMDMDPTTPHHTTLHRTTQCHHATARSAAQPSARRPTQPHLHLETKHFHSPRHATDSPMFAHLRPVVAAAGQADQGQDADPEGL
jgi:hypothetical protein